MRRVVSGDRELDGCTACGALWFDPGEIRELTQGRLSPDGPETEEPGRAGPPETPGKKGTLLARTRREAGSLSCPRCEGALRAVDFQATGIPVFHCAGCHGILASRPSAAAIAANFRFHREHGETFAALGETLARREQGRIEKDYGPPGRRGDLAVPLPVVVPLADDAPAIGSLPAATLAIIALSVVLYIVGQVRGAPLPLPGGLPGLPSGTGFADVPRWPLLFAPFFHAGILPLAAGSLFLFVFGDNVEDRMGAVPYVLLFLMSAAFAGAAHVLWGKAGGPPAIGSAGAVAGVLGAYLVFFPDVSIRMYGLGRIVTVPAYLFACAWAIAAFFSGFRPDDLVSRFLDPAPLSLPGSIAGLGTGALAAVLWRFREESGEKR